MDSSTTLYHILENKLHLFIKKYYVNRLIRGSILFLTLFFLLYIFINLFEYCSYSSSIIRIVLFYSFISIMSDIFIKMIFIPVLHIIGIGKQITNKQAAIIIGKHFPDINDKLLNTLQLKEQLDETKNDDITLLIASIDNKILEIKPFRFSTVINLKINVYYLKYAIIPILIIIFILFYNPSVFTESTKRILHYSTYYEKPMPYHIEIENNRLYTFQNNDYQLKVKIDGKEIPDELYIEY